MYYEPGMAFAGVWDNGDDDYYESAPKYYINSGSMGRKFFDEYLAQNASYVATSGVLGTGLGLR
jgi:hypothetical protein